MFQKASRNLQERKAKKRVHDRYDELREHKNQKKKNHFPDVTETEDVNTHDRQNI